ncbi:helix-turn-helix transcriptional regulator [Cupriavidus metallidurans]|uniref:Helix-turn-helix transcriptional regulator n=1 Tax=Cupriavidus metallidurans TaxID=119219 RepID=A0A482IKP3_9BURK|nr:helix-turn-helix transcriptional regulator [Cupriavidus metallidurans]QBP08691.1 helix-turn-helix transcriptional regulator [Cupriavidus metallidurans]QWC89112.1 helix-turn-helix transcriptional regulator [Cupriavidus metallidurans]
MDQATMHGAIRGLYEGILDPAAWQQSLRALTAIAGTTHASMMVWDTVRDQVTVNEVVNPVEELFLAYENDFQAMDPAKAFAPRLVPGAWYVDARDLGHQAMARHPFYGEFFHKFELGSYMACLVERQPHYEVYFSMQRSLAQGNFSGDDAQRLDWVVPHMRSAIAIRDRTLALSTMTTLATRLIERLAFAVAIYSPDRRLLLANTAGERWARRLDPLGKTTEWQLSRSFMEMLHGACDPAKPQAAMAARATGPNGSQAEVLVLPLPASHAFASTWQTPAALVVVHEAGAPSVLLDSVMRNLYGLTPAETRLVARLATGEGLPEASRQMRIRHETARTQLKAIFLKTGCTSQAQLTHLLTRLAATLDGG